MLAKKEITFKFNGAIVLFAFLFVFILFSNHTISRTKENSQPKGVSHLKPNLKVAILSKNRVTPPSLSFITKPFFLPIADGKTNFNESKNEVKLFQLQLKNNRLKLTCSFCRFYYHLSSLAQDEFLSLN